MYLGKQSAVPHKVLVPQLHVMTAGSVRWAYLLQEPRIGQLRSSLHILGVSRWWKSHFPITSQNSHENVAEQHSQDRLLFAQHCSLDKRPSPGDRGVLPLGPYKQGQGQDQDIAEMHEHTRLWLRQVCGWRRQGWHDPSGLMG